MKRAIDRSSTLPLHSQIKLILIEEMQSVEELSELVLTEAGLMKRFRVSRAPIRQALKDLEAEGYVVRHRAKGTFPVKRFNVSFPPSLELGSIYRYLTAQGLKPTSNVVSVEQVEAPEEVTRALDLAVSSKLLRIQRIISVTGVPLAWSTSYLCTPPEFLPGKEELERTGTVFDVAAKELGLTFTKGMQHVWASGAGKEEAEALEIEEGTPVLVTETILFANDGRPGGWRRAVHRAEDFKYSFGLGS